jgi:threonine aldolase
MDAAHATGAARADARLATPAPRHDVDLRRFGSDNHSGAHPEIVAAMLAANAGHVGAYGADPYTAALADMARDVFGPTAAMYPVFGGTGANVVALAAAAGRLQAVVCAQSAHIVTDEGGAPEMVGGVKLIPVPTPDGKLSPAAVRDALAALRPLHQARPAVVSVTQSTELGTVYAVEELAALADTAHAAGLLLHVDGTRLGNAAVHLGVGLGELTAGAGVDVLSLGGTKNGLFVGDAVVTFGGAAPEIEQVRKSLTQLPSKMRFLSAQLLALYGTDLWSRLAAVANGHAARIAAGLAAVGVPAVHPVESNAVMVAASGEAANVLTERFGCQPFMTPRQVLRIMCAWDTTDDDVTALLDAVGAASAAGPAEYV